MTQIPYVIRDGTKPITITPTYAHIVKILVIDILKLKTTL